MMELAPLPRPTWKEPRVPRIPDNVPGDQEIGIKIMQVNDRQFLSLSWLSLSSLSGHNGMLMPIKCFLPQQLTVFLRLPVKRFLFRCCSNAQIDMALLHYLQRVAHDMRSSLKASSSWKGLIKHPSVPATFFSRQLADQQVIIHRAQHAVQALRFFILESDGCRITSLSAYFFVSDPEQFVHLRRP